EAVTVGVVFAVIVRVLESLQLFGDFPNSEYVVVTLGQTVIGLVFEINGEVHCKVVPATLALPVSVAHCPEQSRVPVELIDTVTPGITFTVTVLGTIHPFDVAFM